MSDISDQIDLNAQAPKRVTIDSNTAEQHPLQDQIAADKYIGSKAGVSKSNFGIKIGRFLQPGTR